MSTEDKLRQVTRDEENAQRKVEDKQREVHKLQGKIDELQKKVDNENRKKRELESDYMKFTTKKHAIELDLEKERENKAA
jgi:peptidoglycan hydrolase CwlO-like protein